MRTPSRSTSLSNILPRFLISVSLKSWRLLCLKLTALSAPPNVVLASAKAASNSLNSLWRIEFGSLILLPFFIDADNELIADPRED